MWARRQESEFISTDASRRNLVGLGLVHINHRRWIGFGWLLTGHGRRVPRTIELHEGLRFVGDREQAVAIHNPPRAYPTPPTCSTDAVVARWTVHVRATVVRIDRAEGDAPRARPGQCMDRSRVAHPRRGDGALSPGHDRQHDPARTVGRIAGGDMPRRAGALGEQEDRRPRSRSRRPATPGQDRHHHGHHRRRLSLSADYLLRETRRRLWDV